MRKRVLSMLLAFALCFTAFAGFAAGGPVGRIESNVDKLDNILTTVATEAQQNAIASVDPPTVTADGEPWSDMISKIFNDNVLETDVTEVLDKTVLPYFFMRWLEERADGEPLEDSEITLTKGINEYPRIMELVEAFNKANTDYDVSKGSITAGLRKFNPYSKVISGDLEAFVKDEQGRKELLEYTEFAENPEYTVEETIVKIGEKQAKIEVVKLLQKIVDFMCSEASTDYEFTKTEGNILRAYRNIMKDDESMKNGAIIMGQELLDELTQGGLRDAAIDFVADDLDVLDIVSKEGSNVKQAFDKDTNTAVTGMHEFIGEDLIPAVNDSANVPLNDIKAALEARGLTVEQVHALVDTLVGEVDPDDILQIIWFDLGLNRVVDLVQGQAQENGVKITQPVSLSLSHRLIDKYINSKPAFNEKLGIINDSLSNWLYVAIDDADNVTASDTMIVSAVDKYDLKLVQTTGGGLVLTYDAEKVCDANNGQDVELPVTLYRGFAPIDEGVDDTERLVNDKLTLTLIAKEAAETDKAITILNPTSADKENIAADDVHAHGDEVLIKGTSNKFELISIYIEAPGAERYLYKVVTPAEFAQGISFQLGNPAVDGIYTVAAGDNEKSAVAYFEVSGAPKPQVVQEQKQPLKTVTATRNTAWDKLKLPETIDLLDAEGKAQIKAPVTWTEADYDPTTLTAQTIHGTYTVSAEDKAQFQIVENNTDYDFPIDYNVEITVDLYTSNNRGGGGGKITYFASYTDSRMKFDGGNNKLTVAGETNYPRVTIEIIDPTGKVIKTVELTANQFTTGYDIDLSDLAPLGIGSYTANLKGSDGKLCDQYKFVVGPDTFMIKDHVNYVQGYPDGGVHPEANITREEVATMLFRLLNDNYRAGWLTESTDQFSDMTSDNWSMTAVATMATAGVINGYPGGYFAPNRPITRAEFAAMTARMCASNPVVENNPYTDLGDTWAQNEILLVTAMGWFEGYDSRFRPNDNLTRAEAITVINRMLGRDEVTNDSFGSLDVASFNDLSNTAWYYPAIVEATNAHNYEMSNKGEVWTKLDTDEDWSKYED